MDHQFIQLIDDLTKDGWNLSTQPKALEIQKDSDFLQNIQFMSIRTKVHLLLQFAISSPEYIETHKEMIQQIVDICLNDKDRWVTEIAKRLHLSNQSKQETKSFLDPVEKDRMVALINSITNNSLFATPIPFTTRPTQFTFGKWKDSIHQSVIQKDSIKIREPAQPSVKGTVGLMRKRYQPTPAPAQPDDKKIRISASTIKIKPKVKATSTETKHGEKPSAPTDVTLPSPIPVASDTPFVQLFFDPSIATKLRLNYNMNKELIEKAKPIPANDRYFCFAGLFVNILRKLGYDGIQNEVCSSFDSYMKGIVPDLQWNNEEKAVDYFVSIKEKEKNITILRLYFNDFSWELIEKIYE